MNSHKKLISVGDDFNRKTFKRLRLNKSRASGKTGFTKKEVAIYAKVGEAQVLRYETMQELNQQIPKLRTLKRICLLLQVDPKELLNLAWVSGELADKFCEEGTEFCPMCGGVIHKNKEKNNEECDSST